MAQKSSDLGTIRCEDGQLDRWHRASEKASKHNGGLSWSQWVRAALDAAADRDLAKR
jgi:hypothetical protein